MGQILSGNISLTDICIVKWAIKTLKELTSFPPTALVRITAEETGGGIHPKTCNLKSVEEID